MSIAANSGKEQGRKDDLEAVGYVLVYLARGQLPWEKEQLLANCKSQKEIFEKVLEMKEKTSMKELCKDLPDEIFQYLNYCKQLSFEEEPDYRGLEII